MSTGDGGLRTHAPLPERLRRRRRLLGWSAPVVLAALLTAALLLGVAAGNLWARTAYDEGAWPVATERYDYQKTWTSTLIEPWKAWFNTGTAEFRAGEHFPAVEELRGALARVPLGTDDAAGNPDPTTPECRVRTNLSLALEGLGDDTIAADDPAMAEEYYAEALDVIGPCSSDGESESESQDQQEEPQSRQDRTEQRQQGKQEGAREQQEQDRSDSGQNPDGQSEQPGDGIPQDPGDGDGDGESNGDGEPSEPPADPRQEELEERNREAERDRDEQQQERGGGFGGGQNW